MPDNILSTLGLIAVMGLLFYLLLIRPQQRRAKEQSKLMDALQPGATVMLSSGIIANVVEIGETQVLVELAPGLEMSVLKQVIINTAATDEFAADDVAPADGALDDDILSHVALDHDDPDFEAANYRAFDDDTDIDAAADDAPVTHDVPESTDAPEAGRPDRTQE